MKGWAMIKSIVLVAALVLVAPFGATAKDDNLPKLDIQKLCRDRAKSITALGVGLGDPFDRCIKDEQQARDALMAAWKEIPQAYRTSCIQPNVYSASYFEWIRCLELNIDVKKLRKQ
jgi:hypothetical protein